MGEERAAFLAALAYCFSPGDRNMTANALLSAALLALLGTTGGAQPIEERSRELERAIARAETKATDRTSLAYLSNLPLAQLKVRKVQAALQEFIGESAALRQEIDEGFAALQRLDEGRVAFEGDTGRLERAYIAANDQTAQPYYLYVPRDYTREKRWPVIVLLHGYVGNITIAKPWLLTEEQEEEGGRNGAIVLTPYGRRNTDFQGVGEVDVFQAIEETKRFYTVDPDRIYLCGPSMGGYGTWTISLRHPGAFAACAPMCSQTDMFVWWPWPHQTAPRFKQFLGEWDNPIDLAPNAVSQSYSLQHGELDQKPLIPVEQSHMMLWELNRLGTPAEYFEHPKADHYIYWEMLCFEKAFAWLVTHRLDPWPKHVRLKSYTYRYDTAFWLRIAEYREWGRAATAEATVDAAANRIDMTTDNVARAEVRLSPKLVDPNRDLVVVADGREVFRGRAQGEVLALDVAPATPAPRPDAPRKRKDLCGPVEDVFNGPFVVVPGTGGTAEDRRMLGEAAATWCKEWDGFADGLPPLLKDTEVTDEIAASHNLVLFGTPQTNQVLAGIADRLPIGVEDHRFTIAGKTYEGPEVGVVFCYPSPKYPDRYVLVYSGAPFGRHLGINHKHDLLPDYFIFSTDSKNPWDDTDRHLCAGFFDLNWQPDPKLMEEAEPDTPGTRWFGSADTIRDKSLAKPVLSLINGFDAPLKLRIDDQPAIDVPAGETVSREVEAGRHRLAADCPDGITRSEERLMVPEFRYQWRLPMLVVVWP
jgi:pimeloyl-ACP methyl ester carboxylesterase